jgi:hypothetical protein
MTAAQMSTEDFVREACPLIGNSGWAYYFAPHTQAKGAELGLVGMEFYVAGRGGPLGDCDGAALASAFGYFNPAVSGGAWESAKAKVSPRVAGKAHLECCAEHGRNKLSNIPGLAAFVAAADAVNNAADPDGLTLYAAIKTEPLVSDLPGRAMQLVTVLREFRGSAHLLALRAMGIDSKTAHFVKRPNDVKMFGWTEADAPNIDDDLRARMVAAEELTDKLVAPAYGVLNAQERQDFLAGAQAIAAALAS